MTDPPPLVDSLRRRVHETLDRGLPRGRGCALLDFSDSANVGDNAIWLGQLASLRRLDARVVFTSDLQSYSESDLAAAVGDGVILLSGGGNFGDLWPRHQLFRESVVSAFPRNRIIQLPQTIHFAGGQSLDRALRVLDGHPDLTLLARDRRSLEFARAAFRADSLLCPDMAIALGGLARGRRPVTEILWLSRRDIEARPAARALPGPGVEIVDWAAERRSLLPELVRLPGRLPSLRSRLRPIASRFYERLAWQRVRRGCAILSRGRVVITDRLHGHILSLLLGIPHVLLDNSYGKVKAFHETWTHESPLVRWAESGGDALEKARALLRDGA